jgi:formate/nitrite transporter
VKYFIIKEEVVPMTNQVAPFPVKHVGKYVIASADMYYTEQEQRDICVYDDPEKGLQIWGETPNGGTATFVDLCQIFLEYGLFCETLHNTEQSYREMRSFGENLGAKLADHIKNTSILQNTPDPGACALESILEAIHAHLTVEHVGPEFRFVVAGCPLLDASKHTGLTEIELAQFGFNVMCQSLIQTVDPHLLLNVPPGDETSQVFTLIQPTHPPLERQPLPFPASQSEPQRKETSDAFPPPVMAVRAMEAGTQKSALDGLSTFLLAILAGAFIAMGAIFATTVAAGNTTVSYGVVRLLSGLAFTLGLIMVVVAGAELFTGNNMIIMAFLSGKVTLGRLLRNWLLVYAGNFVGALLTAYLVFLSKQYTFGNGVTGLTMLNIGEAKTGLGFLQAIALGMGCNALVCMAIWMCFSARSTIDKILAVIAPITAFVAVGFEHSVANMYFIPVALFVKYFGSSTYFAQIQRTPTDFPHLTWSNFFIANLLPVTVGNIIGGAIMVGVMYWLIYLRKSTHLVPRIISGTT